MAETNVFEGRTTNEAIEKGLKELKVSKNDVEIKVLKDKEKRSFFDILAPRVVKVEITVKEGTKREKERQKVSNNEKIEKNEKIETSEVKEKEEIVVDREILEKEKVHLKEFLDKFLEQTVGKKVEYDCNIRDNVIEVDINEKEADFLIGYRGETLNALQTILTAIITKDNSEKIRAELNILDYREKRKKTLEDLAEKIAKTVVRTRKPITLEPMTPYERKIIHSKLQNNKKVKTTSIGEGTHRKVVVSMK